MRAGYNVTARLHAGIGGFGAAGALDEEGGRVASAKTHAADTRMPWCAVKLGVVQQVYVVLSRAPPGLGRLIFSRLRRRAS